MQGFAYQHQYAYPPQQNARQYQAVQEQPFDAPDDCAWDALLNQIRIDHMPEGRPHSTSEQPAVTDKQLRALNRRHLLVMIRDLQVTVRGLEEKVQQEKNEKESLLLAYQAGQRWTQDSYAKQQ
ncbi:MAG: hypothetical protein FWH26_02645 [Oscillospiraceae bacterium]|nr:hypothetical protein [Oscillospiraceae bacterium]